MQSLLDAAEAAAGEGRVKHTLVLDDRHRVKIDARHGHAKRVTLDEARTRKVMGGKDRPLRPDASASLLQVIGIMNADGTISARSAKKYKQVNHFVELCRPVWERLVAGRPAGSDAPPGSRNRVASRCISPACPCSSWAARADSWAWAALSVVALLISPTARAVSLTPALCCSEVAAMERIRSAR